MAWTYILRCRDGSFYTGSTNGDLDARVWQHNHDEHWAARFTIKRRPLVLVYAEQFETIDAAFFREKQIQGWSRAKKQALIDGRSAELPALSGASGVDDASTGSATQ
ncbi:GIY-YIG nuclease family protein [Microbacterium bovistercoris]|uniref:GIY-YIG nuclease family protein n=1 Tax=Microbacterium bovistercoris TaxID=2293570 RepID=A0A371NTH3_9MICO|nr:GIY-YIG nuclease family protein [Microbacterium bovistercoris]REJ05556.1 GIY-YIG nuclease family protein [Microbacterium bovistercoris]